MPKIVDFEQDDRNLNRHTERGHGMTTKSVRKFGPRRPLEIDKNGRIIDGNDRQEVYVDTGQAEDVEVIDHEPGKILAVRYPDFDLDDPDNPAREYQAALHRSAVESWNPDPETVAVHLEAGTDFSDWFSMDEMDQILAELDPARSDGSLFDLTEVTMEDPKTAVSPGDVWRLGNHLLFVCSIQNEAHLFADRLTPDTLFAPYPSPLLPLSTRARKSSVIMVQPDPYMAGHLIDRFIEHFPDEAEQLS